MNSHTSYNYVLAQHAATVRLGELENCILARLFLSSNSYISLFLQSRPQANKNSE